jgi:hypothetical protein
MILPQKDYDSSNETLMNLWKKGKNPKKSGEDREKGGFRLVLLKRRGNEP